MEKDFTQQNKDKPPARTNWLILVVVAAIAAGLIFYFWIGQQSCPQNPEVQINMPAATATPELASSDERAEAQQVLEDFFTYASSCQYDEAAELLEPMAEGGEVATSWANMPGLGTDNHPSDHGKILEIYCETFDTCLEVKVLKSSQQDDNTYQFEVGFINADGTTYEMGPCCGEEGPPTSKFIYYVKKIDGDWKVITAPPYHP